MAAFAIFAIAFVARPFGTAISMAVQRRWGRGTKLTLALFVLGVCTVGMAFLPGYRTAGAGGHRGAWPCCASARVWLWAARGTGCRRCWPWRRRPSGAAGTPWWGQLGAPLGFVLAASLFAYLYGSLSLAEFLDWGWRYPFCVAFAINVVALFARLRLVVGQSYAELLEEKELEPVGVARLMQDEGGNVVLGAFAALASFALFHVVTVFPLSWMSLYSGRSMTGVLGVQIVGALLAIAAVALSGRLADRVGRRNLLGSMAVLIGLFSLATPWLLGGGELRRQRVPAGGLCAAGAVVRTGIGHRHGQLLRPLPLHGRGAVGPTWPGSSARRSRRWWRWGCRRRFGLGAVTLYLLSGVACTLAALRINRMIEQRS
ncbi:general substrate transporter [Alicycliphilus sp. B1]|nr:general substrate transporter [Alicycliphilus sp. B1]